MTCSLVHTGFKSAGLCKRIIWLGNLKESLIRLLLLTKGLAAGVRRSGGIDVGWLSLSLQQPYEAGYKCLSDGQEGVGMHPRGSFRLNPQPWGNVLSVFPVEKHAVGWGKIEQNSGQCSLLWNDAL